MPIVDSRVWQTGSDVVNSSCRQVLIPSGLEEFIGQIRRCRSVDARTCKNGQLELNPLRSFQQMKLIKERSNVIRPGRLEHQVSGRVHHQLEPFEWV